MSLCFQECSVTLMSQFSPHPWERRGRFKLDKPCTAYELIIHPCPSHPDPHHSSQCHPPQEAEGMEKTGEGLVRTGLTFLLLIVKGSSNWVLITFI